ncbi:MAG: FAD-dependent oxidoreductase [Acidobacteriota bacterium]
MLIDDNSAGILIAGAGIVGLALALELDARGIKVTVLERGDALAQASTAAAGMLAVHDPDNPRELLELSEYSAELYPEFVARLERLSGLVVPMQTESTVQYLREGGTMELREHSVDPGHLAPALVAAVRARGIELREGVEVVSTRRGVDGREVVAASGEVFRARVVVFATGAWECADCMRGLVKPTKGQLMRVQLPEALKDLRQVHRRGHTYVIPRLLGPQAGSAIVGATVEYAGFDTETHEGDLVELRRAAAELLPALGEADAAPMIEAWAGVRPMTADGMPLLGTSQVAGEFYAVGHGRNGILLAPATAVVMADLIEGKKPAVDVARFSAERFAVASW